MSKVLADGLNRELLPIDEVRKTELNKPAKETLALPFYPMLPKDHLELLRLRIYIREMCLADKEYRAGIVEMCRQDVCFFASIFCLAKGTLVVTDQGNIPIENVTSRHMVWDGEQWVSQLGAVYKGRKSVIQAYGVRLTPDHKVFTKKGWTSAIEGYERENVRPPHGNWSWAQDDSWAGRKMVVPLRLRNNKANRRLHPAKGVVAKLRLSESGGHKKVQEVARNVRTVNLQHLACNARPVQQPQQPGISQLRRARDKSLQTLEQQFSGVSLGYGCATPRQEFGSKKQLRRLRAGELSLGDPKGASEQHPAQCVGARTWWRVNDTIPSGGQVRYYKGCRGVPHKTRDSVGQTKEPIRPVEVYDLVNCGPNRAFTVVDDEGNPLLVHNCTVFEPRPPRAIPIKLWEDQADVLTWMAECYGVRDVGCEKSRGLGMSWTASILYVWAWLFIPDAKMGVISKDETSVDGPDSNTLLGKMVYLIDKLPAWMKMDPIGKSILRRNLAEHILTNLHNGATIQGFPATNEKVRSLRFTSLLFDEFAFFPGDTQAALNASVHTAPNRIFISTWNGHNEFYNIMRREKSTMLKILLYWWANPARYQGAYTTENGRIKILDKSYKFPPDYPFVDDGLLRSAWVDAELRRAGSSVQSALEELYGLQAEAGRKLFRGDTIQIVSSTIRPFVRRGVVDVHARGKYSFRECRDGAMLTWGRAVGEGVGGPYSCGCDLAAGRGAAYSVAEVFDLTTGEQVVEYADNRIDIIAFAQQVFDLLLWLCGDKDHGHCYLTYENNGDIGNAFGEEMLRLGYGNIMKRPYKVKPVDGRSHYYGMRNKDGGLKVMLEMERAIRDGELIVRSEHLKDELVLWDKDEKNDRVRPMYPHREDGHGDRTQAMAMAWWQGRDRKSVHRPATPVNIDGVAVDHRSLFSEIYETPESSGRDWATGWRLRPHD